MLCVTGAEQRLEQLSRRLDDQRDAPLQEVRLDLLESLDDDVFALLEARSDLVLTCRGSAEGGGFDGSETERRQVLGRALDSGPRYLDLELSIPAELRRELYQRRGETKLILSWHRFEPGGLERPELDRLAGEPADLLKVALALEDAAQLAPLRRLLAGQQRPVLRLGMGPAGLLSRALYGAFGSPWTYVSAGRAVATAPGQLTVNQARRWRVGAEALTPLALVGGPQVISSPGTEVYNSIFSRRGLPFIYLPVVTLRPVETLALLEELGFAGCSVTMPAKEVLAGEVQRWLPGGGEELGALNTVLLQGGRRTGGNTDVTALGRLLGRCKSRRALVLGSGGAARAAVAALDSLGCSVAVAGIEAPQTEALARQFSAQVVAWEARAGAAFDVLVNSTPVGSAGKHSPMPPGVDYNGRVVLDAVLRAEPTPLRKEVEAGGGQALGGLDWWVEQGAEQTSLLTGEKISVEELKEALDLL